MLDIRNRIRYLNKICVSITSLLGSTHVKLYKLDFIWAYLPSTEKQFRLEIISKFLSDIRGSFIVLLE